MTAFKEYKTIKTYKDRLLQSWWENIGKWRAPDKTNEGIWHRIRDMELTNGDYSEVIRKLIK